MKSWELAILNFNKNVKTNWTNSKVKINSLTLNQISTIDLKNDFVKLTFQKIPTLEEVFRILPENIILNIEIAALAASPPLFFLLQDLCQRTPSFVHAKLGILNPI